MVMVLNRPGSILLLSWVYITLVRGSLHPSKDINSDADTYDSIREARIHLA